MRNHLSLAALLILPIAARADDAPIPTPPEGFQALFNGKDLSHWKTNPNIERHWVVRDGILTYDGKAKASLVTAKDYGDFVLMVDWRIPPGADSGIYLRGKPQVQIWDEKEAKRLGRPPGSGGLFNNRKGPSNPLVNADRPVGEWNTFKIQMKGDRVTVHLNGKLVVDDVALENWPEYKDPLPAAGPIELQDHGTPLEFRNIFIKELQ